MIAGTVQSHTIIRVPDKAHAAIAPFVLLLVDVEGKTVLGHFDGETPPAIGSRVAANSPENETPVFRVEERS